jgi:acetyl-CoA acyltransferase 1
MNIAGAIKAGVIDLGIGAGVESMSSKGMDDAVPQINPKVFDNDLARACLTPMGVTSENVAEVC